ncbi:hypothetical protein BWQ96_02008 [Gracilariopsis chorda]|uniref:Uncharacterized protein n=1 Tax=Gracilariopsis chorda TaxID=448386 RepID=A0A2V3J0X4_9FLOR|nr:hypothetical protein BWQ96_02008 [Gracilariopsis chorda]|eukprot:PXF48056.1 hypothetical protein BWQ96_02008 [Gracilariopsis chorda]
MRLIAPIFNRVTARYFSDNAAATPSIQTFTKKAKMLREWARHGVFTGEADNSPQRSRQLERQRHELNKRTDKIVHDQKLLNAFYKDLGFETLPRNHELPREWDRKIARLRHAADKIKQKQQARSRKRNLANKADASKASRSTPASQKSAQT